MLQQNMIPSDIETALFKEQYLPALPAEAFTEFEECNQMSFGE